MPDVNIYPRSPANSPFRPLLPRAAPLLHSYLTARHFEGAIESVEVAAIMPSWLPSIPYSNSTGGYWDPVTSTLNWCEEVGLRCLLNHSDHCHLELNYLQADTECSSFVI